jgi:sensor c-di-GMP phosphodiesterase-like protein
MLRNYFIIFTVIILLTALLNPSHAFTSKTVFLTALFALAGDIPSLVYYSRKELSHKSRCIRTVIHFLLLEVVIVTLGNILGQVSGIARSAMLALEVLLIYALVILITWLIDRKTAKNINQQLENMRAERKN